MLSMWQVVDGQEKTVPVNTTDNFTKAQQDICAALVIPWAQSEACLQNPW